MGIKGNGGVRDGDGDGSDGYENGGIWGGFIFEGGGSIGSVFWSVVVYIYDFVF